MVATRFSCHDSPKGKVGHDHQYHGFNIGTLGKVTTLLGPHGTLHLSFKSAVKTWVRSAWVVCDCFRVQGKCHWHFYFYNKAVGQEVVTCTYIVPHVKTEVSKHSHKRKIDTQSRRQLVIKRFKYQLGTHHQRETKLRRSHSDDILTEVRGIHLIS